ncbi:MAG: polysaccharide biosynthesis tyrosine autokinase [Actinobacteria bacterium]|nr:polysaccharide biosynthesis tyrosine autokinase [Actinomycetota bacterium]
MELRDYLNVLVNRRWIILGAVAVIVAVTLILTFLQSPVYESRVRILSEVSSASESVLGSFFTSALFDPDRYIQTQTEIIKTETMAQAVESHLKLLYEQRAREREAGEEAYIPEEVPSFQELASMVSVEQVQRTNIFDILVHTGSPLLARDVAQAYAEEYIASRQLAAIRQISEARKEVWNRINEVEEQIREVAERAKQYTAGNMPAELQAEAQRVVSLWASLYEKYMTLRIAESLEQRGLEIIQPARAGTRTGPRPLRNGILALFLGLILGVGLAFLVEYLDDTLHTREDFEQHYGVPIIGEIPFIPAEELPAHHIIYSERPRHPAVEGYRTLRTNLQFLGLQGKCHVILFTSAEPEEGKSTVMVNLGAALAELGKRVILVEADLRKPVLDKYFQVNGERGLSNVLAGGMPLAEAVQETGNRNLMVLPAGIKPPNPGELVASEALKAVFAGLREVADFLLVDSPPALVASDAMTLASVVDGVILVARYGSSTRDSARRATELLRRVEARILGLVINNIAPATRYGYYHYYYYNPPK